MKTMQLKLFAKAISIVNEPSVVLVWGDFCVRSGNEIFNGEIVQMTTDWSWLFSFILSIVVLDSDTEWFPKQKVEYARRKLQGWNPAHITKYTLFKHVYFHLYILYMDIFIQLKYRRFSVVVFSFQRSSSFGISHPYYSLESEPCD